MKRKLIILVIIILAIIILPLIFLVFNPRHYCGTPFYIRNVVTNQCEIKVGCSLPAGLREDPSCRAYFIPEVNGTLNYPTILFLNQTLNIVEEGLKIKIIGFANSPCPKEAQCIWAGVGIFYEIQKDSQTSRATSVYSGSIKEFGYRIEIYETDYESYAKINVIKE